jgi:hypothetical protein
LALSGSSFALLLIASTFAFTSLFPTNAYAANTAQAKPASAIDLTIYGNRYAQVEEVRQVDLLAGENTIQLEGIAQNYRPDSLRLISVAGPSQLVFNSAVYQQANLNKYQLLSQSIGKQVTVRQDGKDITGTLKAVNGGDELVIVTSEGKVQVVSKTDSVTVDNLPSNLTSSASLVMEVNASTAGTYTIKFMYETTGVTYSIKHSLVYDDNVSKVLNFDTFVSLYNDSGTDFKNANVHLITGSVADDDAPGGLRYSPQSFSDSQKELRLPQEAAVESVGEQKQYTIPGKVNLANGQIRQTQLLAATNVSVARSYIASASSWDQSNDKPISAAVRLHFTNDQTAGPGRAIPSGPVKVYQYNSTQNLQLTASAYLSEKAAGECFDLEIGRTSDVKFTHTLVKSEDLSPQPPANPTPNYRQKSVWRYQHQVTVHNYKDRDVEVTLELTKQAGNTTIVSSTPALSEDNANKASAKQTVGKQGKQNFEFTLEVSN